MTNDKKTGKSTKNKGVAITSKDLDELSQKTFDDISHSDISVKNVREELKDVIAKMGPNTPHEAKTDHETDDESATTSMLDSVVQVQIKQTLKKGEKAIFDSSQEDSQMTIYGVSDISECSNPKEPIKEEKEAKNQISPYTKMYRQKGHIADQTHPRSILTLTTPRGLVYSYSNIEIPNEEIRAPKREYYQKSSNIALETPQMKPVKPTDRPSILANWFGMKNKPENQCKDCNKACDLYRINIEQPIKDHSPPRRLVFDLLDELPKADTKTIGTNTKKIKSAKINKPSQGIHEHRINSTGNYENTEPVEKVEVYYFDHGNTEYYRTTDAPPVIMTEILAERTEHYTKRFWAQIFGTVQIGISFIISFFLQFFRFLLQAIIRPMTVGLLQLFSDYFIKPCLAVLFNGIIQPPMIFLYNCCVSVRDVCEPVADSIGYFIREISVMIKSFRLVSVETNKPTRNDHDCNCIK